MHLLSTAHKDTSVSTRLVTLFSADERSICLRSSDVLPLCPSRLLALMLDSYSGVLAVPLWLVLVIVFS